MVLVLSKWTCKWTKFCFRAIFDLFFIEFSILKDVRSGTAHKMWINSVPFYWSDSFSGGIILCQDAWPRLHQQRDLQQELFWRLEERNDKWWEKDYQRSQKVWLQRNACILCSGECSEYVLDFFFFVFVRYLWLKVGVRVFELYLVLIVDARICLICKFKKKIARSILLHPVIRIYI